jgi:predicted metalloprotease with PDZ domain
VLGDDPGLGFFAVSVKPHTVFINGPAAFMYLVGRLQEKVRVRFDLPPKWEVGTAMEKTGDAEWSSEGYDELADHPIQLGLFERRQFKSEGTPMEAIFVSESQSFRQNLDEEARQLSELSRPAIRMMGSVPFKKFVYIVHLAVGDFSGGLEHRASTVLAVSNTSQLRLHELATHEFFHAWNVKQIRPKALGPFDYAQKVRVPGIWFSEGVTDYYAHLHAYQAGFREAEAMINMLGGAD